MNHRQIAAEYKEIKVLGRGAFAEVLLAKHAPSCQLFVLKRLSFKGMGADQDRNERLAAAREVEVLCSLRHPHITLYKESFLDLNGERLNIVLEFCEKGTLAGVITSCKEAVARRSIAEDKIWAWLTQLLFAISYCHRQNIIHRDIKPANIFLTNKDQVKLGDFGIARSTMNISNTHTKGLAGTPFYLAPEICEDAAHSMKSDIWALGVSIYELCCLKLPFYGSNILAVVRAITTDNPQPLGPPYSPKLSNMVLMMLNKNPEDRPFSDDLITQFIRPEVSERMEREVLRHDNLQPQGIPLQTGTIKPRRRKRASSVPPLGSTAKLPVSEDTLDLKLPRPNALTNPQVKVSPMSRSPTVSTDTLPGLVVQDLTTTTGLESIHFMSNAGTEVPTFDPLRPFSADPEILPDANGRRSPVPCPSAVGLVPPDYVSLTAGGGAHDLTVASMNSSMRSSLGSIEHGDHTPVPHQKRTRAPSMPILRSGTFFPESDILQSETPASPITLVDVCSSVQQCTTAPSVPVASPPKLSFLRTPAAALCCLSPDASAITLVNIIDNQSVGSNTRCSTPGDSDRQALLPPAELCSEDVEPVCNVEVIKVADDETGEVSVLSVSTSSKIGEPRVTWEGEEHQEKRAAWASPVQSMAVKSIDSIEPIMPTTRPARPVFSGDVEVVQSCRCIIL